MYPIGGLPNSFMNSLQLFTLECPLYNPIVSISIENVILGSLKSFFSLDHWVDGSLYIMEVTTMTYSQPTSLLTSRTLKSIFIALHWQIKVSIYGGCIQSRGRGNHSLMNEVNNACLALLQQICQGSWLPTGHHFASCKIVNNNVYRSCLSSVWNLLTTFTNLFTDEEFKEDVRGELMIMWIPLYLTLHRSPPAKKKNTCVILLLWLSVD
jgi:hypothetical protein